mmetsp:Transcript_50706/g.122321  ORF Transcript_50706/g.122321 Transcript_50706/m.122321 type:complete len:507 (+) Transcript_50706:374-1894(+)
MSYNQPCLPVPKATRGKRKQRQSGSNRRGKKNRNRPDNNLNRYGERKDRIGPDPLDSEDDEDNEYSGFDVGGISSSVADNMSSNDGGLSFDRISSMDAATYMALVTKEASLLPSVSSSQMMMSLSSSSSSDKCGTRSKSSPRLINATSNDNSPKTATETQGSEIEAASAATTAPATTSNVKIGGGSSIINNGKQQKNGKTGFSPIDGAAASLEYLTSHRASLTSVRSPWYLPTSLHERHQEQQESATKTSWVSVVLTNFDNLRQYLQKCQEEGIGGKQDPNRQAVPPMKDQYGWWKFCLGQHEDRDNKNSTATIDLDAPAWMVNIPINGHPPKVRLMLQMDQVMTRKVVSHLSAYITLLVDNAGNHKTEPGDKDYKNDTDELVMNNRSSARSVVVFEWLYALLARFETPIHRDDAAILYNLLKDLTKLRACINVCSQKKQQQHDKQEHKNDDKCHSKQSPTTKPKENNHSCGCDGRNYLAHLNTLITVIGIYLDQGGDRVMKFIPS